MENHIGIEQITDPKGHVFLDLNSNPFLVRKWGGHWWIFKWHTDSHWVSLRKVTDGEQFPDNLTVHEQQLYHNEQTKWERQNGRN